MANLNRYFISSIPTCTNVLIACKIARYRTLLRQGYRLEEIRTLLGLMEHLLRLSPEMMVVSRDALRQVEREELGMERFMTSFEELARVEGQRELILRLLERKVGLLASEVQAQVAGLQSEQLIALSEALFDFSSPADLATWLDDVPPTA